MCVACLGAQSYVVHQLLGTLLNTNLSKRCDTISDAHEDAVQAWLRSCAPLLPATSLGKASVWTAASL